MRRRLWLPAILFSLALATGPAAAQQPKLTQAQAQAMVSTPGGIAQFAWMLFVQAMQPAGNLLMFETWAEQCQLNPLMVGCPPPTLAATARPLGHGSALLAANRKKTATAPNLEITQAGLSCNPMATQPVGNYPQPANVAPSQGKHEVFDEIRVKSSIGS